MQNAQKSKKDIRKEIEKDIQDILTLLEEEISVRDRTKEFKSERGFQKRADFVNYLKKEENYPYSQQAIVNAVNAMIGGKKKEEDEGKINSQNAKIVYDKDLKCYRLNSFTFNPFKSWAVTPLSFTHQLFIETSRQSAFLIADYLDRQFQNNDIRVYPVSDNLILCLDLELGENQNGTKKRENFYAKVARKLNELNFFVCDYTANNTPIHVRSNDSKAKNQTNTSLKKFIDAMGLETAHEYESYLQFQNANKRLKNYQQKLQTDFSSIDPESIKKFVEYTNKLLNKDS